MFEIVIDFLEFIFVGLAISYIFLLLYDYCKDRKKEQRRKLLNNLKIDYVLSQVYFNNQHLIELKEVLDCIELNISEIFDLIEKNECSVKDDD